MMLIALSFVANIAITFTVSFGIWRDHPGMTEAFGADTPARRILACVYITIGLISLYSLFQLLAGHADAVRAIVLTLFPLQILYKLMTARALWVMHPVVLVNLGVSALLILTLLVAI